MRIIKWFLAILLVFSLTGCIHHHRGHNGGYRAKTHKVSVHRAVYHNVWVAGHWKKGGGKTIWVEGHWK